ncbi:response regulator [Aquiflexum sp. TKW24L]|uniref:response regulator n=1 Tax=Aquiflexum sp. TKW24L TaxID=2942212 RepID=UPI0020BE29BA|nr:response regulator [Aquiflexum sp. TKW24L]MCL6261061.1 response regulator [Aquiflexum sp. TKW24L]
MNRKGPIIIIEDDWDDQDILKEIFESLSYPNEVMFFNDGEEALKYLTKAKEDPFIIFSDINMPKLNGMELREQIQENEELRVKSIPFLFFSTTSEQKYIVDAYSKSVQGFFIKPNSYKEIKETIMIIMEYWSKCVAPNYVK